MFRCACLRNPAMQLGRCLCTHQQIWQSLGSNASEWAVSGSILPRQGKRGRAVALVATWQKVLVTQRQSE
eukprot:6471177-Amphidinium_carterae.4